ncbi:MAG: hypothetical protein K0Q55_3945 [Verrucomicrobia bacterium]|jgi:hypothetical protein|nr:hypothetical protein [Verrucomicrobiota bacterium]
MANKLIIVIALLLVAGMGFLLQRQQKLQSAWQSERAKWEDRIAMQQLQQAQAQTAQKSVTEQMTRLQEQLALATNDLTTAKLKVKAYEAKRQLEAEAQAMETKKVADLTQLKAEVPLPKVAISQSTTGKEQRVYTFPKLTGKGGNTLATDAEFRMQFGRRFVFRAGSGQPVAYDVDELHPGVLLHLGLNREAALAAQQEIDRQAQIAAQKHRAQLAARAEADKQAAEQRARLAVEFAKVAEERRKGQAEEQLKLQAAETERLKAEASMRAADAAVQEALRPFYPEYFIQQVITPPPVIIVPQAPNQPTNPFVRDPRIN